ncbi:MAG: TonB family protein [Acidobacteriia bacterium]|nr:TonB family protein [Terriglobia bacterium]
MRLVIALALATSWMLAQDASTPQAWQGWLNQGVQAYKSSKFSEAVAAFQKAVELNPNGLNPRLYLATAWMSQFVPGANTPENLEMARRAEAEFMEVLRLDPNNKTAIASLASLKYQQAQGTPDFNEKLAKLDEASSWYLKLIEVDPQDKEAYYSLGVIDWARWYPAWLRARADQGMKPSDPGPMAITALRQQLKEQYSQVIERGISYLERALAIDPQYDDAMAYLNLFIRERADLDETREDYNRDVALADQWVQKALDTKKSKAHAEVDAAASGPRRIRVGGNVQQANLARKVNPVYPPEAKQARIQGTVRMSVIIDKSGTVQEVRLLSGHPLLVGAAMGAVRQWVYKPTLLNGQPVEVETVVDVNFTFGP